MARNRFEGPCYRCGKAVGVGEGHFERNKNTWRVQHALCAIKHRGTNYRKGEIDQDFGKVTADKTLQVLETLQQMVGNGFINYTRRGMPYYANGSATAYYLKRQGKIRVFRGAKEETARSARQDFDNIKSAAAYINFVLDDEYLTRNLGANPTKLPNKNNTLPDPNIIKLPGESSTS